MMFLVLAHSALSFNYARKKINRKLTQRNDSFDLESTTFGALRFVLNKGAMGTSGIVLFGLVWKNFARKC